MDSRHKVVKLSTLKRRIPGWRRQGKKIAFTNGCFDILHFGHIRYLETAKRPDRVLIIGLNSDASIRRLKGPQRPINAQAERAAVLAALSCVDFVTVFAQDTPQELIRALQPDILIKGADWKGKKVVGRDIVLGRGGKVELIRYLPRFSTSKILKAARRRGAGHG